MLGKLAKKAHGLLSYGKCLFLYGLARLLALFVRGKEKYRDLWLLAERGADARDNGYHLFKYLRENRPDCNCLYVIRRSSPDYEKVASLGKTVETGSFAHYLAFACACAKISTHIMGYAPDTYRFAILDRKLRLVKGKKVLLQHGIIEDDIAELHYPKVNLDLFVCSTAAEYESLVGGYNFPDGVIRRIGLCRYDALTREHEVRRQILIMPTWRYHLRPLSDAEFQKSDYYQNYNGLLNSERLQSLLEEYDYELVLYLHYELQKFSGLFSGQSDRVKVRRMADADVQQLLMESAMLITDYSSVHFDFAFMKKPLLYWMFDRERFFSEQYGKGYFVFEDDGFGPVLTKAQDVIDGIEKELKNGMKPQDEYLARIDRTFSDFSGDHCRKTSEAIAGLLSK